MGGGTHPDGALAVLGDGHGQEDVVPGQDLQRTVAVTAFEHIVVVSSQPDGSIAVDEQSVDVHFTLLLLRKELVHADGVEPLPRQIVDPEPVHQGGDP